MDDAARKLAKHEARASPAAFSKIPTVMSAQEIMDKGFGRAAKVTVWAKDRWPRFQGTEIARLRTAQNNIHTTLAKYVGKWPSFDRLPPFYQELLALLVDMDQVRKALGGIDWAAKQINTIGDTTAAQMKASRREDHVLDLKKKAYGRFASILKQIDPQLRYLNGAREEVRRLPTINTDEPTIVVAGYPNVGKSSLIRAVSSAEPEVAPYPFTTKGVAVGHFTQRRIRYQIVDTPGLLDRDLEARNAIERQATAALRHLAHAIVFILDPSEQCGYSMEAQLRLLDETRSTFPNVPVIVAENKVDLARAQKQADRFQISTVTGEGIEDLMKATVKTVEASPLRPPS